MGSAQREHNGVAFAVEETPELRQVVMLSQGFEDTTRLFRSIAADVDHEIPHAVMAQPGHRFITWKIPDDGEAIRVRLRHEAAVAVDDRLPVKTREITDARIVARPGVEMRH